MTLILLKRALCLILATCLVLMICSHAQTTSPRLAAQSRSFGRYRPEQLTDQINNVNRLLGIPQGQGRLSVHPILVSQGDAKMLHLWCVGYQDARGNSLVESSWDADTGCLVLMNHEPQRNPSQSYAALDTHSAAQSAWHWMQLLGVAQRSSKWSLAHSPSFVSPGWIVTWRSPDYRVIVTVDRRTHDLCRLAIKKLS